MTLLRVEVSLCWRRTRPGWQVGHYYCSPTVPGGHRNTAVLPRPPLSTSKFHNQQLQPASTLLQHSGWISWETLALTDTDTEGSVQYIFHGKTLYLTTSPPFLDFKGCQVIISPEKKHKK